MVASISELAQTVEDLSLRLQRVQDELEVTRLLTCYGFAVDGGDADGCAYLYADDAVVILDDTVTLTGRQQIRSIVTSDVHQAVLPHCAHVMGPFAVEVFEEHATAAGYMTVYTLKDGVRRIWRQGLSRFELSRHPAGWRIDRRESWSMGRPEGQALARRALHAQIERQLDVSALKPSVSR
jgi:ketosteroid isomerase-like protein